MLPDWLKRMLQKVVNQNLHVNFCPTKFYVIRLQQCDWLRLEMRRSDWSRDMLQKVVERLIICKSQNSHVNSKHYM